MVKMYLFITEFTLREFRNEYNGKNEMAKKNFLFICSYLNVAVWQLFLFVNKQCDEIYAATRVVVAGVARSVG